MRIIYNSERGEYSTFVEIKRRMWMSVVSDLQNYHNQEHIRDGYLFNLLKLLLDEARETCLKWTLLFFII